MNHSASHNAICRQAFQRDGFLKLSPFLTGDQCAILSDYAKSGKMAAPYLWEKGLAINDPFIYEIATKPELLQVVSSLLGETVILWGSSLIVREPEEVHPWHTDLESSAPDGHFVSVWIGFENTSSETSLNLMRGSHLFGCSLQQLAHEKKIPRGDRTSTQALALAKAISSDAELYIPDINNGEAILFDGRIWHGSDNTSSQTRKALLLQYAAAGQEVRIPKFDQYEWPFTFDTKLAPCLYVLGEK